MFPRSFAPALFGLLLAFGLVLVTRDHLGSTLGEYLPVADQAVGLPDEAGRGHAQNLAVWRQLSAGGRIAPS